MYILGLSCFYHDSAACLLHDGEIIAAAQEERFSRVKHDARFPAGAVAYCLKEAGITIKDLANIVYYDKPIPTFDRLLTTYMSTAPRGLFSFLKAMPLWLTEKLSIPNLLRKATGFNGEILFTEHHEAHAASAFYPSPFNEAAILTLDGVGEWATASYGYGRGHELTFLSELHFPHSLGLLYSAFTYFTGFRVNSGEYKLMGLAPYGNPIYKDLILEKIIDLKEDGSLRLNMEYFDFMSGLKMTNKAFGNLFGGPARAPESPLTQREMDIAASIQVVTDEAVLRMVRHVHKETGMKNLCLAGGVALNCVSNGKVLRTGPFEQIWIQPAAGDAGGALGAALAAWHRFYGNPRPDPCGKDQQRGSYLGPAYTNDEIKTFLDGKEYPGHLLTKESRAATIAGFLAEGKIVGYLAGRMEFGPRALGARSILGDARSSDTQTVMNLKIKFRESFRPFAPSVLEEKASEYFAIDVPSPYMLLVADVREERRLPQPPADGRSLMERLKVRRSDLPAITHLDYSARLQTVSKEHKPDYHAVIKAFEDLTGCAVIVNTSFNVRGEPIVCSPEDAYRCFMRSDIDVLVLEDYFLLKPEQPAWGETSDAWRNQLD